MDSSATSETTPSLDSKDESARPPSSDPSSMEAPAIASAAAKCVDPKRVQIQDLEAAEVEKMRSLWREQVKSKDKRSFLRAATHGRPSVSFQERYVDHLESKVSSSTSPPSDQTSDPKSSSSRPSNPASDSLRREHLLVMRLSVKEQELQEMSNQVAELKTAQVPSTSQLRSTLVDPGVNAVLQQLRKELEESRKKQQETQEELNAWKFTPDSATGKRLMSKCRQLLQENEELGKMISGGRLAKLEGELSMQRVLCDEMKKNQLEMDEFVQELDEDVEGMQSTVYFLQQQLKEAKEKIKELESRQGQHISNRGKKEEEEEEEEQQEEHEEVMMETEEEPEEQSKSREVRSKLPLH
jgi:hypothetical protein